MNTAWNPPVELSEEEERILKLCKKQKLWSFLRKYRHVLFDDEIRAELARMYAATGRGRPPDAPERLALAMLLQVAFDVADHEVPTLTAVDRRWQMVLNCLDAEDPIVSQGSVFNFRERARAHGLMKRLLDKTVELARATKGFSHKRLRAIFDASPLVGAGRVEDTFNLLGRAIGRLVEVAAAEADREADVVAEQLGLSVALASSVKAALDVDWREPQARAVALHELVHQFDTLLGWLRTQFSQEQLSSPPLAEHIEVVKRIIDQDTEPDPDSPSGTEPTLRIRQNDRKQDRKAARDRQISLSDPDMRHGRKSKSKVFAGYKRHVVVDADIQGLICETEVQPANKREHEAAAPLLGRLVARGFELTELHIDRGYLASEEVVERHRHGLKVISKPPSPPRSARYTKDKFDVDSALSTITCPGGTTLPFRLERTINFPAAACRACGHHDACVGESATRGRQIKLGPNEKWYREMAAELGTPEGRARRRQRVAVEHALARVDAIQGHRARFLGLEKNQFDLERTSVVNNCYVLDALFVEKEAA